MTPLYPVVNIDINPENKVQKWSKVQLGDKPLYAWARENEMEVNETGIIFYVFCVEKFLSADISTNFDLCYEVFSFSVKGQNNVSFGR